MTKLWPTSRFSIVEDGVFRGGFPRADNVPFLETLDLRTVVALVPSSVQPAAAVTDFYRDRNITIHHIETGPYRESGTLPVTLETLSTAINILIDPRNYPVYIHCLDGSRNTGLVLMALRRLCRWPIRSRHAEFMRYIDDQEVTEEEQELVDEMWMASGVTMPCAAPSWLMLPTLRAEMYGHPVPVTGYLVRKRATKAGEWPPDRKEAKKIGYEVVTDTEGALELHGLNGIERASEDSERLMRLALRPANDANDSDYDCWVPFIEYGEDVVIVSAVDGSALPRRSKSHEPNQAQSTGGMATSTAIQQVSVSADRQPPSSASPQPNETAAAAAAAAAAAVTTGQAPPVTVQAATPLDSTDDKQLSSKQVSSSSSPPVSASSQSSKLHPSSNSSPHHNQPQQNVSTGGRRHGRGIAGTASSGLKSIEEDENELVVVEETIELSELIQALSLEGL